jgi:hypothetical protein
MRRENSRDLGGRQIPASEAAQHQKPPRDAAFALLPELLDGLCGDLLRTPKAVQPDLDDLPRHDFANRVVAINQTKPAQGQVECLLQPFGIFRFYPTPLQQTIYRHIRFLPPCERTIADQNVAHLKL